LAFYSVRLLIRCTGKGQPARIPLYEDRIVIVRSSSHEAAERKAREIVARRSVPYRNALGNMVRWRVDKVVGSMELFDDGFARNGAVKDGLQVYWRYIRSSDPMKRLNREGAMNSLY